MRCHEACTVEPVGYLDWYTLWWRPEGTMNEILW